MKKGNRGFTLIELLVVIAIIAILAAILFPVFTQARAKARQISCLSNVKNLSLAILMYVDDNDGKFPLVQFPYLGIDPTHSQTIVGMEEMVEWPNNIGYLVGAPAILHCPADGNMSTDGFGGLISYMREGLTCGLTPGGNTYGSWQGGELGTIFGCSGVAEADVAEPGNTIMIACAPLRMESSNNTGADALFGVDHIRTGEIGLGNTWGPVPCDIGMLCTEDTTRYSDLIHNGGSNFGFADGHAKWMKMQKTYYPRNLWTRLPNDGGWDPFGVYTGGLTYYGYTVTTPF